MRRKILFILLELAYGASGIYFVLQHSFKNLGLAVFCAAFTFVMYYLVSHDIKPVSDGIYVTLCGFVFMATLLGSCFDFYGLINHYDDFLHLWSGIICAQVGFAIAEHLLDIKNGLDKNKKLFILLFVFFMTMGCASLWEIYEFLSDKLLGLNMQAGGLVDTCVDMIDALIGCLLTLPYINHLIKERQKEV